MDPEIPEVGTVMDGFRFNGGDPSNQDNWEQVEAIDVSREWGNGAVQLPNGAVVRYGPRGGIETLRSASAAAESSATSADTPTITSEQRGRLLFGVSPAVRAQGRLSEMEAGGEAPLQRDWGASLLDSLPDWNALQTVAHLWGGTDYQAYDQASASIEAALLPVFSGMAVTDSEARRFIRANLPRLGDSPETLAEKARNRMEVLNTASWMLGRDLPFPDVGITGVEGMDPALLAEIDQASAVMPAAGQGGGAAPTDPRRGFPSLPGFGGPNNDAPGGQGNPYNVDQMDRNQLQQLQPGDWFARDNGDGTWSRWQLERTPGARADGQVPEGANFIRDGVYVSPPVNGALAETGAFFSGAAEQIPFGDEIAAGVVGAVTGDGYDAVRQFDREQDERDRMFRSGARNAGGITGGATGLLLPGGQIMNGARGWNALARGAGLGASYGALYGAGAAEDGQRLSGAVEGGVVGGVTGGLAEPVGQVVGRLGTAAGRTVDGWTGGRLGELVNGLTGGAVGGAENGARARMIEALRRDGYDGPALQNLLQRWQQNGGTDAALIDLVTQNGGGQNFMSLVRASALRGGGASAAARQYRGAVEGGATDEALNLTRGLTPDNRSAPQVRDDLVQDRSRMADQQYREPYRTVVSEEILPDPANRPPPVDPFEWFDPAEGQALIGGTPQPRNTLPPNVRRVLEDSEGARAVGVAMRAAIANSDDDLVRQLRALRQGDDSVPITARALDRIRISFREMAEGAAADQRGSLAAGLRDRVDRLDGVLDDLPELRDARAAYRAASQRIEGVDLGAGAYSRSPGELTDQLTRSPAARDTFGLGLARDIEGAIGRQGDGSTGLFNRLATAPNARNALAQAFGPERGGQYQNALGQIVDRVRTARAIDPGFGSQTAQRGMDALIEGVAPITGGPVAFIMRKLNEGLALTDAEREIIVRYATSMPDLNAFARSPSRPALPRPILGAQAGMQSQ